MSTCPLINPTKQEVFDYGLKKIIEQGRPSLDPDDGSCLYRGPDGVKCLVGHMLGEDVDFNKRHSLNGIGIGRLIEMKALPEGYEWMADESMQEFLGQLQNAHDHAGIKSRRDYTPFIEDFKERMKSYAVQYGLVYKEPA